MRLRPERIWDDDTAGARTLRAVLQPFALVFATAVRARAALYDRGVLPQQAVGRPVVSVGNLRVGGTGKTPFVIWLCERLVGLGLRPVVVSRGYGAPSRQATIISTPRMPMLRPALPKDAYRHIRLVREGGYEGDATQAVADEALLVAMRTGIATVTAVDRVFASRLAIELFDCDLLVLDDAFQHRRLRRNVDIVLLNEGDTRARMLPAGPLREGVDALKRAHFVVVDGPSVTRPSIRRRAVGLVRSPAYNAPIEGLDALRGASVLAVCGIARPQSFVRSLEEFGARVHDVLRFPDHHGYGEDDWTLIERRAKGVERIVTTEKDLVKLAPRVPAEPRLAALRIDLEIEASDALIGAISDRLRLDPRERGLHDRPLAGAREAESK